MTAIGIDIGGTKTFAVRMNGSDVETSSHAEHDPSVQTTLSILEAVRRVADGSETAIGVGVAGLVSSEERLLAWGPHLSGTDARIGDEVEAACGVPVVVDNDANTALFAELAAGAAVGYRNVLLVTLGTGIGGAIAIDGDIYRGNGFAGEWGHMQVVREGLLCDCGKRGCWETTASGPALERLAREVIDANPSSSLARAIAGSAVTGLSVVAAADSGDETARALVAEIGRAFGQGLADLAAIFDPDLIVVGGGLGSVGEAIVGPARRTLSDALHGGAYRVAPAVQVAQCGPAAGAIGAAMMSADWREQ